LDGASFGTPPLSQQRQVLQPAAFSPHQFHSNSVYKRFQMSAKCENV
jgi:hypothetical protein